MGMKSDPNVMNISTGKNTIPLNSDNTRYAIWCYGSRFVPTGILLILCHALTIAELVSSCSKESLAVSGGGGAAAANETIVTDEKDLVLAAARLMDCSDDDVSDQSLSWIIVPQLLNFVSMFVFFLVVSMSFLSRNHQLWQRHPGETQT